MLLGGQRGKSDGDAPQQAADVQPARSAHFKQFVADPGPGKQRIGHVHGGKCIARRVHALQDATQRLAAPVDPGLVEGGGVPIVEGQASSAHQEGADAVPEQAAQIRLQGARQGDIDPKRKIDDDPVRREGHDAVDPGVRHDGDRKHGVVQQLEIEQEEHPHEGGGTQRLEPPEGGHALPELPLPTGGRARKWRPCAWHQL